MHLFLNTAEIRKITIHVPTSACKPETRRDSANHEYKQPSFTSDDPLRGCYIWCAQRITKRWSPPIYPIGQSHFLCVAGARAVAEPTLLEYTRLTAIAFTLSARIPPARRDDVLGRASASFYSVTHNSNPPYTRFYGGPQALLEFCGFQPALALCGALKSDMDNFHS